VLLERPLTVLLWLVELVVLKTVIEPYAVPDDAEYLHVAVSEVVREILVEVVL
jgi:hypothetical protein